MINFNSFKQERLPEKYTYFDSPEERKTIFHFSKELAEYIHDQDIHQVIFLDRSARLAWVGVDTYWKTTYPESDHPEYFFLNPDAFDSEGSMYFEENIPSSQAKLDIAMSSLLNIEPRLARKQNPGELYSAHDLDNLYPGLAQSKANPILVFDTCSHSGKTLRNVRNALNAFDYKNLKIVTANEPSEESSDLVDHSLADADTMVSCYPFGRASGVKKDETLPSQVHKEYREIPAQARKEIREIIKEHLSS
ncbi:hypothetical protein H6776_00070 [Candidatus Nomurabacteria bacterium]|nr:hypothetical protein [Candidatus Nomurabacteria bacterium]